MNWCTFSEAKNTECFGKNGVLCVMLHMMSNEDAKSYLHNTEQPNAEKAKLSGMSFTVMHPVRPVIYFNESNWNNTDKQVDHFKEDMLGYRMYLVMHEMYHAIGFKVHIEAESVERGGWDASRPLNIMCQQTRGNVFAGLGTFCKSPSPLENGNL